MARGAGRTICAIASAPGVGERALLRLSGPGVGAVLRAACHPAPGAGGLLPPDAPRGLYPVDLDDGAGRQPALVLWMPGPRSFTREDVAELHLCGNPFLVAAALRRLLDLGAEPARPGEFTRRAFESGRIDLTRAEGVLALVEARDRDERRAATALLAGGLDRRLAGLREGLDDLRALSEASLDFDEADTGHVPTEELARGIDLLLERVDEAARWELRRTPAAAEPRIVLLGAPNAGKSSLFNRLTGGGGAPSVVSPLAGTTRDSRRAPWTVAGVRCVLVDTAGLDPAAVGVAAAAQERTGVERAGADLELVLWDASRPGVEVPPAGPGRLVVATKLDAADAIRGVGGAELGISAHTGRGLDALERAVARALGLAEAGGTGRDDREPVGSGPVGSGPVGSGPVGPGPIGSGREMQARHRAALAAAGRELALAREGLQAGLPLDLWAEHLRGATAALDEIHGRTTAEDLLDRIFARFCLGK